jgi:hypothetical protein
MKLAPLPTRPVGATFEATPIFAAVLDDLLPMPTIRKRDSKGRFVSKKEQSR